MMIFVSHFAQMANYTETESQRPIGTMNAKESGENS